MKRDIAKIRIPLCNCPGSIEVNFSTKEKSSLPVLDIPQQQLTLLKASAGCWMCLQEVHKKPASANSDMFRPENREQRALSSELCVKAASLRRGRERQCFWRDDTFADLILRTKEIQCAKTEEDY